MRFITVKEFRDNATKALKSKDPLIIMRRGEVAGIFLPTPWETIPIEFRKELFVKLVDLIKKDLEAKGIAEEEVLRDFESYRKTRRRR
ncbi:MAG: hypothetical protein AB1410_06305 [Acidobacteriota bacterium]